MISIRALRPDDIRAVMKLVAEAGFPSRSAEGWHWAFFENPDQAGFPEGLVAERDGRIISMIGLQTRTFSMSGRTVPVTCGHTFISSHDGRGAGFALAKRALAGEGAAATYSLNNNAAAGTFHKRIGLSAWLGRDGRKRLEWPVHTVTVAAGAALSRLARNEETYEWLSRREWFTGAPASLSRFLPMDGAIRALDPADREDAALIDDFSATVCACHRAAPVRSAHTYAYQLADPDAPGRVALLGIMGRSGLDGLIQLAITKPNTFEPAELGIIDLEVLPGADQARIVPQLVRAALSITRHARLSRLRLPFSERFEPICFEGTGLRLTREQSYDMAHALFQDPDGPLASDWAPTGFEGDMFFALRLAPHPVRAQISVPQEKYPQAALGYHTPKS